MAEKKILIIEKNDDVPGNITNSLRNEGFRILPADKVNQAEIIINSNKPDLIIFDMNVASQKSSKLWESFWTKLKIAKIPIILLSESFNKENLKKMIFFNGDEFLRKPFRNDDLIETVKKLLTSNN